MLTVQEQEISLLLANLSAKLQVFYPLIRTKYFSCWSKQLIQLQRINWASNVLLNFLGKHAAFPGISA